MKVFVSYHFEKEKGYGFGNAVIETTLKKMSEKAMRDIEKVLAENYGYKSLVILNYKIMRR